MPWSDCSNEWNTANCRNPYEMSFNESCKLSDELYDCSLVGEKYRDCAVSED